MVFQPSDGQAARWRRVDDYIDSRKKPGDLISFQEIEHLLGVDRATAASVIHQVRAKREKAGKPTLVSARRMGWTVARPDEELAEDTRRHVHLVTAVESRVRLLGSLQQRRASLSAEEQHSLDFRQAQAAAQATLLGSRKMSAKDILGTASSPALPITAQTRPDEEA